MKQEPTSGDGLNTPLIAVVGFVSAILTFALIIGVQVLYYHAAATETDRKVIAVRNEEADDLVAQQEAKLARYEWRDRAQGQAVIPVERAMQLVVQECQEKQKDKPPEAKR
jgi:hypothetical protein